MGKSLDEGPLIEDAVPWHRHSQESSCRAHANFLAIPPLSSPPGFQRVAPAEGSDQGGTHAKSHCLYALLIQGFFIIIPPYSLAREEE